ncbi:hypothetical protein AYR72_gp005 [Cnaphalocrocis medinalis granulovirus]|uniref:ClanGV_gp005 n=1 Tax=Cnaphalocrocis medinalis granulovirus TaxID=1750712 RepID=A0A0X9GJN4_9BBAC|nr:hypothetical protein AYR72_gp005 [Cnaphalocrocis medinalis granulovirus]ALN41938.1 ClanGV_gp005 [Cnaphalocrocis medinalis granulovirus]AMF83756.1 hypothetical protein [Cnaphalocrocis medinalis granulovirus]WPN08637.1 hypothetical protein [Cnaphalocrocis medinalis granulovirus]
MDNILNYEEQVEWNRLQDMLVYIKKSQLDDDIKCLIENIMYNYKQMMNTQTKTIVLCNTKEMLTSVITAYKDELKKKDDNYGAGDSRETYV